MKKLLAASSLLSVFLAGCGSQVSFDINMKNISEDTELKKAVIAVHGRNYNLNANQNEKIATAVREFLTSEDPSQLKQALFEAGAQKVLVVNDPIAPGKTVHFDFQYDPSISKGVYLTGYQKIDSSTLVIKEITSGLHDISKKIMNSKKPIIIIGESALNGKKN